MTRDEFINIIDKKIKLIRTEKNFSQDKMAQVIGLSKKTLINVEKGRGSLGWAPAVTACAIFRDSELLDSAFGGDVMFVIQSLAFDDPSKEYVKTLGGKVWWREVRTTGEYKIQQNIISNHYRLLDLQDRRICSSYDLGYIEMRLKELTSGR